MRTGAFAHNPIFSYQTEIACRWLPGTKVRVIVTGRFLTVSPAALEFVWAGGYNLLEFDVVVAPHAREEVIVLKVDIFIDNILMRGPRTDLLISPEATTEIFHVTNVKAPRRAFASYAMQDRLRVLDRIATAQISAGLDVFLDCFSLHPNERWKPRLATEIKERDFFLLFWSNSAQKSQWVEWEWQTALAEKGKEAIQFHPLEPNLIPPEPLQDVHCGDPLMFVREGEVASHEKKTQSG